MNGIVDNGGRSLLSIEVLAESSTAKKSLDVWIDTGFTGELVIPRSMIEDLNLIQSGTVDAVLADGSLTELSTYSCSINWFGSTRRLEVIANDGDFPLLGVGLLLGLHLQVDYLNGTLSLEPAVEA